MSLARMIRLGALALLLAAVFSKGFHHWDEHFQILEFAGWKLGLSPAADLPWEFESKLRPALQPLVVVALYKCLALFGTPDPFILTLLLRLGAAALSFASITLLVCGQLRSEAIMGDPNLRAWYLFLSYFLWFGVYNAVRFSSEGLSASLFLLGFVMVVHGENKVPWSRYLIAGLLLGLAFVVRYQVGFMVGGLLLWAYLQDRKPLTHLLWAAMGILLATGIGILADRWFYGEWTLTLWTYFHENIVAGRAASFSTEPWWEYFAQVLERAVPPFSLLYLLPPLLLFVLRPKHVLTWTVLPFLLVHMIIGHKELRFLFPMLCLLPLLVIHGAAVIRDRWWPQMLASRGVHIAAKVFLVIHVPLLLVTMFKPADGEIGLYRTVYVEYRTPITLYFEGEHPYHRVEEINFYRRPGLSIAPWNGSDEGIDARCLFVGRGALPEELRGWKATVKYTTFPDRVKHFNVGGWVERSNRWTVWELEHP